MPGLRERRAAASIRRSGLFDTSYYLDTCPGAAASGLDPVLHYLRVGAGEGCNPNPLFDSRFYVGQYPDVAEARINPLLHFIGPGVEGLRCSHPEFDTAFYAAENQMTPEVNPLAHYLAIGGQEGRRTRMEPDDDEGSSEGSSVEPRKQPDTAVVLHLYYTDLWSEMRGYLETLGSDFDLFVSLCRETGSGFDGRILADFPRARIRFVRNRGMDIGPFLETMAESRLTGYRYVCKVHSKKTPYDERGTRWRVDLLHQLLGSPFIVREIKRFLDRNRVIGILGPANHLLRSPFWWFSERPRVVELAGHMGIPASQVGLEFFAGSMFWFRPVALRPLLDLSLGLEEFEATGSEIEGTLAHAVERAFTLAVKRAGYKTACLRISRPSQGSLRPEKWFGSAADFHSSGRPFHRIRWHWRLGQVLTLMRNRAVSKSAK